MGSTFAAGLRAYGFCDRCAFRYPLGELKAEVVKMKVTGLKVCPKCHDPDHPQLQLGMWPVNDPQALRDPRVDVNQNVERTLYVQLGAPETPFIGDTVGCVAGAYAGNITSNGSFIYPFSTPGLAIPGVAIPGI